MQDLEHVFGQGGLLSQHIDGYAPRPQQFEMATAIQQTLNNGTVLVAEAGTGTGKTYAYLAPAILSGQKVFISTGTKNLQDQLFNKDLPTLRKALATPFRAALLKGRSNYLCHYRLEMAQGDPLQKPHYSTLQELSEWSGKTRTGDLSESDVLEDSSPLWSKVTSTIDNCLGQECPNYSDCFISEARKKAQEADVVVINHHLLMSDMALKASGQGEVLPSADAYIIDEAHQLPEIATQFLGNRVSSHQILELCRDSIREMEQDAADMKGIRDHADKTESALKALRLSVGETEQRIPWLNVLEKLGVKAKVTDLTDSLENLADQLELAAERGKGLEQCHSRCNELIDTLAVFNQQQVNDDKVLWIDIRSSSLILHATPQEVSHYFQQWMDEKPTAWVFTSATLTVAGKFNNFNNQLGINEADSKIWPSPFDYERQSLLYMPRIPVEPMHDDYNTYITEIAKDVISHSKGRTFLLFTSYRAMHAVAEALEDFDYPLLVQGSASKSTLLEKFRNHGNAILLGTNSFWEGVDVRGEALSCVIIDKIPFASPGDPVLQARIDSLRERGGNPFASIQIPAAVIQLKQGIGRLIRDPQDYGVLVLCDPRFLTKPYGKLFLRSLPAMPITQNSDDVEHFFAKRCSQ
ncbi:MAG: ATP-dependent DNA helicase [Gammaproteobacteria bacterium]|nr:ATP-dependent DNA helicase [Gammaproteobacteria bacterium]MDH5591505.1 ATP-dependent DNA helicase [Gammaproteobacteria bacterium]